MFPELSHSRRCEEVKARVVYKNVAYQFIIDRKYKKKMSTAVSSAMQITHNKTLSRCLFTIFFPTQQNKKIRKTSQEHVRCDLYG